MNHESSGVPTTKKCEAIWAEACHGSGADNYLVGDQTAALRTDPEGTLHYLASPGAVSEMTYIVSSETLNYSIPYHSRGRCKFPKYLTPFALYMHDFG